MKARILILSLVLLAACQPVEMDYEYQKTLEESTPQAGDGYTLTLEATKGVDTKALSLGYNETTQKDMLNAYWVNGEKVGVYVNGTRCGQLLATAKEAPNQNQATLSGTVYSALQVDDKIELLYPDREDITVGTKWDYTGQTGAAPTPDGDLSQKYDYMTASLTVTSIADGKVYINAPVSFQSEQSIYRFDFKENDVLKAVKWFTLSSSQNKLVTSRSYDNGWVSNRGDLTVTLTGDGAQSPYVSLRNENNTDDTYSFLVVGGDDALYSGTKEIPAGKLGNGKFLAPGVTLTKTDLHHSTGLIGEPDQVL